MLQFTTISSIQQYLSKQEKIIGFVPTMGALHEGHLSLIQSAKDENQLVVCSIFINPTQFENQEDLASYPQTIENDKVLLKEVGCDVLFTPSENEMYPSVPLTKLSFGNLEKIMEGQFRNGHFNGVAIIVSKLFNIIRANNAYFGQKDLQQLSIIKRMVNDLNFNIQIKSCPIIRETNGLAMSSRNRRLSKEARSLASHLYFALSQAKEELINGGDSQIVKNNFNLYFVSYPEFEIEYFEIVDLESLNPIPERNTPEQTALCLAAHLDGVRLIDNMVI